MQQAMIRKQKEVIEGMTGNLETRNLNIDNNNSKEAEDMEVNKNIIQGINGKVRSQNDYKLDQKGKDIEINQLIQNALILENY